MSTVLSADDLRTLADQLDDLNGALILEDGTFRPAAVMLGMVQVVAPGTVTPIGELFFDDGWVGLQIGDPESKGML